MTNVAYSLGFAVYLGSTALAMLTVLWCLRSTKRRLLLPFAIAVGSFYTLHIAGAVLPGVAASTSWLQLHLLNFAQLLVLVVFALGADLLERPHHQAATIVAVPGLGPHARPRHLVAVSFPLLASVAVILVLAGPPLWLNLGAIGHWVMLVEARTQILFGIPGIHWISALVFDGAMFFVVVLALWIGAALRSGRIGCFAGIGLLFLGVLLAEVIASLYLQKSRMAYVLLSFAVACFSVGLIGLRGGIWTGVVGAVGLFGIYLVYLGFDAWGFKHAADLLWHRVFEIIPLTNVTVLDVYPKEIERLWGASIPDWGGLVGRDPVDISKQIYPYIYGDSRGTAPVPATFSLYANFGYIGYTIACLVNALVVLFCSLCLRSSSVAWHAIGIVLTVKIVRLWQTEYWFGFFEFGFLGACTLYFFMLVASSSNLSKVGRGPVSALKSRFTIPNAL